jgi:thiosulfate dehydrogenase [quinone] large subunit
MAAHLVKTSSGRIIEDPPLARFLFSDTRLSALWTVIRVLIGYAWITAGLHKLGDAGWMVTGASLQGYWANAVAIPANGHAAITFDWYRAFIQGMLDSGSYVWFAKLIALGEFAVGLGLIVGGFVGIAAFFAALMNWSYIMAGSTSTNPLLLIGAIVLILAWKTAGYYGLDFFLLPRLGTPWSRRKVEVEEIKPAPARTTTA